jgi:hypothetical protein
VNNWQRKVLTWISTEEAVSDKELLEKGALTAILFPSFRFMDWLLVAATASIFSLFKYYGFTEYLIWIILWILNLLLSWAVVLFNDRIKVDVTMMQTLRKFINFLISKTKKIGYLLEVIILGRLLLWDGPDQLFIFFRDRIPSKLIRVCFFVSASGIQMFIWSMIYAFGYDSLSKLLKFY